MTTALGRTSTEVASVRAQAQARLSSSDYMRARARAVLDTLDWAAGDAVAPASRDAERVADGPGLLLERRHATSDETTARRSGGDSVYPGVVAHTVSWLLCDEATEPPIW